MRIRQQEKAHMTFCGMYTVDCPEETSNVAHDPKFLLLYSVVRLSTQQSLSMLLDSLIANMERYSEDQLSIYRCLHDVGRSHADFISKYLRRINST
jgi:hypothetical protein